MNTKKLALLGILGVVAVGGFFALQKVTTPPPAPQPTAEPVAQVVSQTEYVDILAADQDLPIGTKLTADMLKWRKWPAEALEPNLIDQQSQPQALEDYVGAVTRADIYKGEPILSPKVVKPGERGQMAAILKPGMRAVSTRITTDTAAGGFIQPGDRVDVVLTTQIQDTNQGMIGGNNSQNQYVSSTIFENVPVLAIGQVSAQNPEGEPYVIGSTALLQMSPTDAEVLIEAQSKGDISLVLRGLDRRRVAYVPSAATAKREKKTGKVSSMVIYRKGKKQQVAIQGH